MAGIGISAVDAVAEDRHISQPGLRDHQQFVHGSLKTVQHGFRLVCVRIEKQDLAADLVDRDHATHAGLICHRLAFVFLLLAGFVAAFALAFGMRQAPSALSSRTDQYSQARATGPGRRLYSPASAVSPALSGDTCPSVCAWICIAALRAV